MFKAIALIFVIAGIRDQSNGTLNPHGKPHSKFMHFTSSARVCSHEKEMESSTANYIKILMSVT